jgi:hypothetical protein
MLITFRIMLGVSLSFGHCYYIHFLPGCLIFCSVLSFTKLPLSLTYAVEKVGQAVQPGVLGPGLFE